MWTLCLERVRMTDLVAEKCRHIEVTIQLVLCNVEQRIQLEDQTDSR